MPIYSYQCTNDKCKTQKDYFVTKALQETTTCVVCNAEATRQPSFKVNAHGLPNGFAPTRSMSRGK